jgi:hypothetical protein
MGLLTFLHDLYGMYIRPNAVHAMLRVIESQIKTYPDQWIIGRHGRLFVNHIKRITVFRDVDTGNIFLVRKEATGGSSTRMSTAWGYRFYLFFLKRKAKEAKAKKQEKKKLQKVLDLQEAKRVVDLFRRHNMRPTKETIKVPETHDVFMNKPNSAYKKYKHYTNRNGVL